jgi:hypothetical protein
VEETVYFAAGGRSLEIGVKVADAVGLQVFEQRKGHICVY